LKPDYEAVVGRTGQLKIPVSHKGVIEPKLKLVDIKKRELHLRVSIQSIQGKGMELYISAPVWIINKTGLPLICKQEGTNNTAAGQFEEHETARQVAPLMFSFSDQEGSPALVLRLGSAFGSNNLVNLQDLGIIYHSTCIIYLSVVQKL